MKQDINQIIKDLESVGLSESAVSEMYDVYIDSLDDSASHKWFLRNSDKCFWEFAQDLVDRRRLAVQG